MATLSQQALAVIIFPNQNEVSTSEIAKIRRTVKKSFPEYRLRVYANEKAYLCIEEQGISFPKEARQIIFTTSDVNGEVGAAVDHQNSTVSVPFEGIAL